MACSKYQGKNQCGFHSAHYVLTDQHVQEYCSTDRFQSCSEIENFAQSPQDTESEFRSQLDRDALAKLGQPMHNWRFKPTAFDEHDIDSMRQAQRD